MDLTRLQDAYRLRDRVLYGHELRRIRLAYGYTLRELAARVGYRHTVVSQWERGELAQGVAVGQPDAAQLVAVEHAVAQAVGVL